MSSGNVFWMAIMDAVIDVYREWIDEVIKIIDIDTKEKLDTAHKNILSSLISKDKEKCENAINLHYDIIDDVLNSNLFTEEEREELASYSYDRIRGQIQDKLDAGYIPTEDKDGNHFAFKKALQGMGKELKRTY